MLAIGLELPKWLNSWHFLGCEASILAVCFLILCTFVSTQGSDIAGTFNNFVTSGKLFILGFLVIISLCLFKAENFDPFLSEEHGFMGVMEACTILFFGYLGFDFVTTISEEAINPARDVPIAVVLSVFLCMLIYAVVAFAV